MSAILITILGIAFIWLIGGCMLQRKMLFPRFVMEPPAPDELARPAGVERWEIDREQGVTEAWFMPGRDASAESPAPAVIFAHGNAELIDHNADWLTFYTDLGISVLLVEYRGYGRSDGSPSQTGITGDFVAACDRLAERAAVDADRIILHGRSVGGGVACAVARRREPAALILQSTFTSTGAMAARYLYPAFLILDPFDNAEVIADYEGPVLLFHGTADTIIPTEHSRKLHAIAPDSRLHEYNAGHNDFPVDSLQFHQDVETFLRDHAILAPRSSREQRAEN